MTRISDESARAAAVDPTSSYCVSAPAGSGKTGLLIQRYLCLLARVRLPEQVLAITFTRKAAAEMRERVMAALESAHSNDPGDTLHHGTTRVLARQVLAADERGDWQLLRDSSRLNIKTIDSFCAGLTRQMPVLSQLGGQLGVQDDATPLYTEAVTEFYKLLDEDHPVAADLAALMLHFDNNWERLQVLLVSLLARRDQWRGYVGVHYAPQESEAYLVDTVETLVSDELGSVARLLYPHAVELLELLQFAATSLSRSFPTKFPGNSSRDLQAWHMLKNMLLTQNGSWRKSFTKREGFPAGKGEPERRKQQLKSILANLEQVAGLQARLASIPFLPVIEKGSASWQLLLHLSRLLPTLAAQLLLVFQKRGVVDHSQVAQSALLALGDDDEPTELALRLDYQIEHILVDEFQDTAVTQFELLHKLTRGWGDYNAQYPRIPRTLMIVGDGMQSIYGFRGANVGLFLRARQEGFNGVALSYLELRCNFRSDKGVVDWVNQTFEQAFPSSGDMSSPQVRYTAAEAVRPAISKLPVVTHAFVGDGARGEEIEFVCHHIAENAGAGRTIAVLGRSRSHLQPIIKSLKQLKIPYFAPDLDTLAQSPVVSDLMTLCRALTNDADRLAWMALLRAPWCGLQLADLLCVAQFGEAPPNSSVWSSLINPGLQGALTPQGRAQLGHTLRILHESRGKRDRLSMRIWIEATWVGLGGPQCVTDAGGLQDAESFLQLLEQAEAEGVGLDVEWLSRELERRYMSAGDPECSVKLMTLHKAKGLEFDCVIIPQLDRSPRSDGRALLLWDEHCDATGRRSFLLAADDHCADDDPTLYNYLRIKRREKTQLEATRLLYVGATRAVSQLLLTACITVDRKSGMPCAPARQSLLHPIWPTFLREMTLHESRITPSVADGKRQVPPLIRLLRQTGSAIPVPAATSLFPVSHIVDPPLDRHVERSIGTVVHLALEELSLQRTLPRIPSDQDERRWRMALQRNGLWGDVLEDALESVLNSVARSLQMEGRGRWMLSCEHANAHSELTLTTVDTKGRIQDIVIDRTFIDKATGERWVIDYKSSQPRPGEPLDVFTARETATHIEQLRRYRDALRELGKEPLRCALFFTALGQFHPVPELDLPVLQM